MAKVPKNSIATPNLQSLVERRATAGNEDEVRRFFDIKRKPGNEWLKTLKPGIDACQRVLGSYISEQTTGDANAGDTSLQADDAEKRVAHVEREKLCEEIFGQSGTTDLDFLRRLSTSIKSKSHIRIDFTKGEEGRAIAVSAPDPALPEKVAPEDFTLDDKADTMPHAVAPDLEALLANLRPRVRLNPDEPKGLEQILRAVAEGRWTRKVAMLMPINRDINPHVVYSLLAHIRKQPWMGFHYETDTVIQRARNLVAQAFLKSESEWAWFLDSDNIAPFADPNFFFDPKRLNADHTFLKPEFVSVLAVERLLKAEKTIVGGVYQARRSGNDAPMIIQPELHPRDSKDREIVAELKRSGPMDKVIQVGYVATGCALIHRKVFLDIMAKFPERQPDSETEPFDFFGESRGGEGGEDIFFCGLAQQAGHASHLDLGLWCAHLGAMAFFPQRKLS